MLKLHKIIMSVSVAILLSLAPLATAWAASGVVNASYLNVRSGPGTDYSIVKGLNGGADVEVLESKDGWYKISNNGTDSFVKGQYITLTSNDGSITSYYQEAKYAKVTANALNVREDANVYCNVIGSAQNGTCFEIIGEKNGFAVVSNDGKDVFMSKDYLEYVSYDVYEEAKKAGKAGFNVSSVGQSAVNLAMQYIGVPYVYGGSSPKGFDCSGLTSYVYAKLGYKLNRTAAGQASNGTVVSSKADLLPGDLVLFDTSSYSSIGHVGIYIGNGNMVHAPKPGYSVCVTSIDTGYYAARYVGARRL